MKIQEIREQDDEQLADSLRDVQRRLFRLRFQAATEKLEAPSDLRKLRRTIARIMTVQRERELAAASESEPAEETEAATS